MIVVSKNMVLPYTKQHGDKAVLSYIPVYSKINILLYHFIQSQKVLVFCLFFWFLNQLVPQYF